MGIVVVTGSSGLIGSEACKYFHSQGLDIVGIDNNMREYFFGKDGSTTWNTVKLQTSLPRFQHKSIDIRDEGAIDQLFQNMGSNLKAIIHTAAQPSHDWAAREPHTDFTVNANGTLNLLEATRKHAPEAIFIFTSTNKVYGDTPNRLPLTELDSRWELVGDHPYAEFGIDEFMSIDQSKHSLFGSSKVAADIMVQEYGRYFGMNTAVFRGGCLTGPAHSGAELHGFLAYLVRCALEGRQYTIFGYQGKQVRDNIHSHDLVSAFWEFFQCPKQAAVYNIGGSRHSNCSILEAIALTEKMTGKTFNFKLSDQAREGDHIWWVSDVRRFQKDFPNWSFRYDLKTILSEIVDASRERYGSSVVAAQGTP